MERYTNKDFESIAQTLTNEARLCGMIEPDERVYINRGSSGYATVVTVLRRDQGGERAPRWLPRFTPKDTARVQYKAIAAAADALRGAWDVMEQRRQEAFDQLRELEDELDLNRD